MDPGSVEREIRAPADLLWSMVSDLPRMPEWSPENVGVTWVGGTPPAVGSRFRGRNHNSGRTWWTQGVVETSEPGRAFTFRITVGPLAISEWGYRFESTAEGTRVVETWVDRRPALLRGFGPLATGVKDRVEYNRASMAQTLDALKAHAEASAG